MPRGASPKREREYEHLVERFEEEHRYPGREAEVAARIVNKQRRQHGETDEQKQHARAGHPDDEGLPIAGYLRLKASDVVRRVRDLPPSQKQAVLKFERTHANRATVLRALGAR